MTGGAAIATSCSGVITVARAGSTKPSVRCLTAARSVPHPVDAVAERELLERREAVLTRRVDRHDDRRARLRAGGGATTVTVPVRVPREARKPASPSASPPATATMTSAALQVVLSGTAALSAGGAGGSPTACPNEFR